MAELLDRTQFRSALEDAIKGREAKNASFSLAWANGELTREHFAGHVRVAEHLERRSRRDIRTRERQGDGERNERMAVGTHGHSPGREGGDS